LGEIVNVPNLVAHAPSTAVGYEARKKPCKTPPKVVHP